MHLLIGLLLFLAVVILTGIYLFTGWTVLALINTSVKVIRKQSEHITFRMLYPKHFFLAFFSFFLVYNISFYMNMRSQWIWSEGNAHLDAKEYFVSGEVLYGFRKALNALGMHPENPIMYPLNVLQTYIYDEGVKLLPKDDAEWAVWEQLWFSYLYTYRDLATKDTDFKADIEMINLLNQIYGEIEAMSTLPILDKRMYEQHYLRNLPGLADYYVLKSHFFFKYEKTNLFWVQDMINSEEHMERLNNIFIWLNHDLSTKWDENEYIQKQLQKVPELTVLMLGAIIGVLEMQVIKEANEGSYTCQSKKDFYYREARRGMDVYLKKMKDKKQAELTKDIWWHLNTGLFIEKINRDFCQRQIYGSKMDMTIEDYGYLKKSGFVDMYNKMKNYLEIINKVEGTNEGGYWAKAARSAKQRNSINNIWKKYLEK